MKQDSSRVNHALRRDRNFTPVNPAMIKPELVPWAERDVENIEVAPQQRPAYMWTREQREAANQ